MSKTWRLLAAASAHMEGPGTDGEEPGFSQTQTERGLCWLAGTNFGSSRLLRTRFKMFLCIVFRL